MTTRLVLLEVLVLRYEYSARLGLFIPLKLSRRRRILGERKQKLLE